MAEELRAEGIVSSRWWTVPEMKEAAEAIRPNPFPWFQAAFGHHVRMIVVHAFRADDHADIIAEPLGVKDTKVSVRMTWSLASPVNAPKLVC